LQLLIVFAERFSVFDLRTATACMSVIVCCSSTPAAQMEVNTQVDRSAGAARIGRLHVGAIASSSSPATATKCSIPSRFETVLNTNVREQNAFGSRTFRFDDAVNDRPGPGAYHRGRSLGAKSALSTSTKGSAAFAPNFKKDGETYGGAPVAPGPTSYLPFPTDTVVSSKEKKRLPVTAAFRNPQPRRLLKMKDGAKGVPGPCSYLPQDVGAPGAKCSAMSGKAVREVNDTVSNAPRRSLGPGEYFADSTQLSTFASAGSHGNGRGSHFNKSATARFGHDTGVAKKLSAVRQLPTTLGVSQRAPLPGVLGEVAQVRENEEARARQARGKTVPARPPPKSAMFADTVLDRFGKSTVRYTADDDTRIGPGTYEVDPQPQRMLISSAWALSGATRDDVGSKVHPPGPAYYQVSGDTKKVSHRMLSNDYWS
jgi:hypothetical protein